MNTRILRTILAFLVIGCADKENNTPEKDDGDAIGSSSAVFKKVEPSWSGINFSNTLVHDVATKENLFDYDYFYNGAGVGVEDLNNDGLFDVFFCGNQVQNRLFLNEGNLKFKDITESSKIKGDNGWSTGVTFVDINNDGWKDIYVSQGGPKIRDQRKNLLFINQKDGTFLEKAQEYGLADMGISTQSAFFDLDNDGDLDCIVMNENELYGVDPVNLYRILKENPEEQKFNSAHLYRNDNGKFVNITAEAGLLRPLFGLGLSISDINSDGWLDIYLASDYYIPDALFINNGNGTFTDKVKEYTNHISYYGMGLDIADINNDGLQDIFVLDMASNDHVRSKTLMASMSTSRFDYLVNKANFHYQYMYNSLQLNMGNNKFNNIEQLTQMANTDWSWSVLMSDFDHDEDKDVYITNGYRRYALDNDLQMKVIEAKRKYRGNVPLEVKRNLYESMPSEKLPNILYQNGQDLNFKNVAQEWGLADFSFSNGAATADLDNDGDLDLVVNNIDENAFLYQNLTSDKKLGNFLKVKTLGNNSEPFAKVRIAYNGKSQFVESKRVRGYMSSHDNTAHFGLGKETVIDTVAVTWLNGKVEEKYKVAANTTIEFEEKNAEKYASKPKKKLLFKKLDQKNLGLGFTHKENFYDDFETEILLPYKQSSMGPFISKGDINGDGKDDVHIGGASGQAGALYVQVANGFQKISVNVLEQDSGYEDMESTFFDLDQDGDLDLYVVSGGNEFEENSSFYADRVYINDGKGQFSKLSSNILNKNPKSGKTVVALDFDKDGDNDIIVGNRIIPKKYPRFSPSVIYENDNGVLKDVTSEKAPELIDFGIVNKIISTDFNNDGWQDFIAVGEWTPVGFFENRNGIFRRVANENQINQEKGWWFSVNETDINNDGLKDYLVGNVGLNLKFKASKKKPFKIFANDFDDNGTNDIVLSKKYNGEYVPVRGRECSSQQMPFIQGKFPTYNDFANASLSEIYGEKLNVSYENEVTEFNSMILVNKGNGTFEKRLLPIEAQIFPIMDAVFMDINHDGFEDAIIGGNIYETEVETPRLDAFSGLVLISNGKGDYYKMDYTSSGLSFYGNVKSLSIVEIDRKPFLINTANNGNLGVHTLSN
ncbi:VCBS repeat-containing protein [Spongiimicrobium sp. 3-5]|uniref:VCBS repeat-containing protein n=1 Tax=Spongiimicrobium sp. 3-5 TaxID=3332596 RepID=UPI003980D9C0